VLNIIAE